MAVDYVLINFDLEQKESVIENLKYLDYIKEVQGSFGAFDILAKMGHSNFRILCMLQL